MEMAVAVTVIIPKNDLLDSKTGTGVRVPNIFVYPIFFP